MNNVLSSHIKQYVESAVKVNVYLVNGTCLRDVIAEYDDQCIILSSSQSVVLLQNIASIVETARSKALGSRTVAPSNK